MFALQLIRLIKINRSMEANDYYSIVKIDFCFKILFPQLPCVIVIILDRHNEKNEPNEN